MVKATMPSILNTVRNIVMRLYSSVEEVVTICLVFILSIAALVFISTVLDIHASVKQVMSI